MSLYLLNLNLFLSDLIFNKSVIKKNCRNDGGEKFSWAAIVDRPMGGNYLRMRGEEEGRGILGAARRGFHLWGL